MTRKLQTSKAGFATKAAAQDAPQQVVRTLMTDVNLTEFVDCRRLTMRHPHTGMKVLSPEGTASGAVNPRRHRHDASCVCRISSVPGICGRKAAAESLN